MVTRRKTPCTCKPCLACGGRGYTTDGWSEDYCEPCHGNGYALPYCRLHLPFHAASEDADKAWGEFREAIYAAIIPGVYRVFIALDDFKTWRARRRIDRFLRPSLSVRLARRFPRIFNRNGDLF